MTTEVPSTPKADYNAVEDTEHTKTLIPSTSSKSSVRADGYKPIFMGQSAFDLWFIPLVLILCWGTVGTFFTLLLQATVKTTPSDAALWLFFAVFMIGVAITTLLLNIKDVNAKTVSADAEA
ncbi:Aste57867_22240 [Aphanomyces stellatus]|uniref:Aste57867_22240 protein n=1 Tax=Aphanomyces stellatus TaxID=120398 RepID=A0A485LL28_9STRA|nr:hypothetical protein As57867_022171 [Aphanomyces stellatus]VFT98907.1 Aste57867_22240 [Aphanomyces stellatus]